MEQPKRYHPALVVIHWITAVLIIFNLIYGVGLLTSIPNEASKQMPLALHMTLGLTVLVLTLARIFVRYSRPIPAPAEGGNPFLDRVAAIIHILLYIGALGMGISGLGIAVMAGILPLLAGQPAALPQGPEGFFAYPPRTGHSYFAYALFGLVALHIGAALYHQFIVRDNLISRMWFRK